jgi:hypothetical protein
MQTMFTHLISRSRPPKASIRVRKPDPQPRMRWYR